MRPVARAVSRLGVGVALALLASVGGCKRGSPPTLFDVGEQVAVVGEQLVIQLVASDPDGDTLSFSMQAPAVPDLLSTTALTVTPSGLGVFTFTPLASQIGLQLFDFTVSDGRHSDTLTVVVDVRGALGSGSLPVFRKPLGAGTVLDLDQTDCLELPIVVDDQDSTSISLTQEPPLIEGASLAVDGNGLTGSWSWCPDRRQTEQADRYYLTLVADDGDNPPVTKEFAIVLRRRAGEDCPGKAPLILHTPADFTTKLDLPIVADVTDDVGLGSAPYVVYATEDPGDPIDFTKTTLVTMSLQSGDDVEGTWRGQVPNFLANEAEGTTAPLYYLISASDDDDVEGDCDHRSDDPQSGMHRVNVTLGGDDTAALCEPCSFDVQCGDADDLCLPASGGGVCGQGCSGSPDCGSADYVCSNDPVQSVEGATGRQCIPVAGSCGSAGGNCTDDLHEPNDTPAEALAAPPIAAGSLNGRVLCGDNDDWYAVELTQAAQIEASIDGDAPPDMDLSVTDATGVLIDGSTGLSSSESVQSGCQDPGTYLLRVYSIDAEPEGEYDLSLTIDTAGCGGGGPMGGVGDCCIDNNSPGCEDPAIEACVCAEDAYCCSTEWDDICAGIATNTCMACGGAGSTGGGMDEGCCTPHGTPGCDDMAIETCVCALDAFCCSTQWDAMCVGRVGSDLCGPSCDPDDADGPCCTANGTPGCEVNSVESCVCAADAFCCTTEWDQMCVDQIGTEGCGTCP